MADEAHPVCATRQTETAVIDGAADVFWGKIRDLKWDMVWAERVTSVEWLEGGPGKIGSTFKINFKDETSWTYVLCELSDLHRLVTWELITAEPPVPHSSQIGTIKVKRVTASDQTFIQWTTDFSSDVTAAIIADNKYKKLDFFAALNSSKTDPELDDYYVRRAHFVDMRIKRLKEKIPKLTCQDYHAVDMINWTKGGGLHPFMKTYTPGPDILDIGAGLGGLCRTLAEEYNSNPIGVEYGQDNVDLGNSISREVGMPEFLQWGDASVPMDFTNKDAVIVFSVLCQIPPTGQEQFMKNVYNALKPGGVVLFEDPCFLCPNEEIPEIKQEAFEVNHHIKLVFRQEEYVKLVQSSGLELIEKTDVSEENALGIWSVSEEEYLKVLEEREGTLDDIDIEFNRKFGIYQTKIFANLTNFTSEELRKRFPRVCKVTDPDTYVHGTTHNDVSFLRMVLKRPEN